MNLRSKLNELNLRRKNDDGFNLIDVVVTVAIIIALSIGGFLAYDGLVSNAKQSAVDAAAANTYRAALNFESDGNPETTACKAVDEYNATSSGIKVSLQVKMGTNTLVYYTPGLEPAGQVSTYTCD